MDDLNWFKIDVLYKLAYGFDGEEPNEVERIQLKNEGLFNGDEYEKDTCIVSIVKDPILRIEPRAFVPKGKTNKKYYSEIIFESGNVVFADGKPVDVYEKLNNYYNTLPTE